MELGNKLRKPSYISLYTVLGERGVVFQPYPSIYLIANRTEVLKVDGQRYVYRKIKREILLNPQGLTAEGSVTKAGLERALADKVYLDGLEYFDNLRGVDWELLRKLNQEVYGGNSRITRFIRCCQEA